MTLKKLLHNALREEVAGGQAVESTGGVPPWGSGANRPPPKNDGPVEGLLL
jgi:hypothetical protein